MADKVKSTGASKKGSVCKKDKKLNNPMWKKDNNPAMGLHNPDQDCNNPLVDPNNNDLLASQNRINSLIDEALNGAESLYGFCGWLTTREKQTVMSSKDDCAVIAELIDKFIKNNKLEEPRDDWTNDLTHPVESITEAKHSRNKCMLCKKATPEIDIIWADGRGRAWFCDACFPKWEKEEGDWAEVVKKTKITNGEVPEKYGESFRYFDAVVMLTESIAIHDGYIAIHEVEEGDIIRFKYRDSIIESPVIGVVFEDDIGEDLSFTITINGDIGFTVAGEDILSVNQGDNKWMQLI